MIDRILANRTFLAAAALIAAAGRAFGQPGTARLPGYATPVPGRWLESKDAASGVPLGGLGTGFLELRADGRFHEANTRADWVKPGTAPAIRCYFTAAGQAVRVLGSGGDEAGLSRYFGHYPAAELDYGTLTAAPVKLWLRAYAPFVPQDPDLSNLPAVLFSFRITNFGRSPSRVEVAFETPPDGSAFARIDAPTVRGLQAKSGRESLAIAARTEPGVEVTAARGRIIAVLNVAPGAERRVVFAVAWHSPSFRAQDGAVLANRYASRYLDAADAARGALQQAGTIEAKIIEWQSRFYARALPAWMTDAELNALAVLARRTIWLEDGRLLMCDEGGIEEAHARLFGSLPRLLLFPEQQKRALRELARLQRADGAVPRSIDGTGDFSRDLAFASAGLPLLLRRDCLWTGDRLLQKELYPVAKHAVQYLATLDRDADGLVDEPPVDNPPPGALRGTASYTAGLGLAAFRAGEELAKAEGDAEFAAWCHGKLDRGRAAFEESLWTGRIYRLYTDPENLKQSDASYVDQLAGQGFAWLLDLGDLLKPANVLTALRTIGELNGRAGEAGPVATVQPDGSPAADERPSVDVGPDWSYVSAALQAAGRLGSPELQRGALEIGEQLYRSLAVGGGLWLQPSQLDAKSGRSTGSTASLANLSVWQLPFAIEAIPLRPAR